VKQISACGMAVPIGQSLDRSDSGFGSRLVEGIPDDYASLTGLTIREGRKLDKGDEVIIDGAWKNRATKWKSARPSCFTSGRFRSSAFTNLPAALA
jgi:hypothetical protein